MQIGETVTTCVPVTPTAKYPVAGTNWGSFVIGGEIMQAYPNVYQTLEVNKTSRVKFEILANGDTVICSVCSNE